MLSDSWFLNFQERKEVEEELQNFILEKSHLFQRLWLILFQAKHPIQVTIKAKGKERK